MKKERPLLDTLMQFQEKKPLSMHVPGHKNGILSDLPPNIKEALKMDVTELTGLDDLHHPEEAIKEAQQLLAKAYGADESFFLVNGSTVGNLAMVYATCKPGDIILIQRNAHKSIFHAIELVGAEPVYIAPEWDGHTRTSSHVATQSLKKALHLYPMAKAAIFTYPTYYGLVNEELEEQIQLCHAMNIPVLVDEAHGAHLHVSETFPKSALQLGADVVVQSAHKTLPAMTMGSFIHIRSKLIEPKKIQHYLRMLQSSSPSYLIMASLDDARHYISTYLESDAQYLFEKRQNFINALTIIKGIEVIEVADPLKLLLRVNGYNGYQVKEQLEKQGVFVELADVHQVLLILPLIKHGKTYPFTTLRTKIKDAVQALQKLPKQEIKLNDVPLEQNKLSKPEKAIRQIRESETEWISYTKAIGRISAELLIPYPPGIPLFVVGEKITIAKLTHLSELLAHGAEIQGNHQLEQNLISVMKE